MEVAAGSAQDSGVETEGDQGSNDSNMSNASANEAAAPAAAAPPASAAPAAENGSASTFQIPQNRSTPEPSTSAGSGQPPPSVTEDGYLGDCSSDGGNEKNFPMPAHLVKRLVNGKSCPCHPESKPDDGGLIEPPAGLAFQNVASTSGLGYQVLPSNGQNFSARPYSRKMKSSLRSKLFAPSSWSQMTLALSERRLRMAASTNNSEKVAKMLAAGARVDSSDDHKRTALHFSASKGYANVVKTLLENGADPNAKDMLGNTALHLAACTNHIEVVTLLLRGGTDVTTLDNNGRTPMQLAQSKLKLLQKNNAAQEMTKVKTEVAQVVDMMREYLSKTVDDSSSYSDLLNSFSQRLTLHNNKDEIHSDLQNLLDSLGGLHLNKT